MRVRLREFPTNDELNQIYDHPYQHTKWSDHIERVSRTVQIASDFIKSYPMISAADLSCGDKAILGPLAIPAKTFGDMIGHGLDVVGPIEKTLPEITPVDFFVLSETLEHLNDPEDVTEKIRQKTSYLLLTTPLGETNTDNPEHIWGWDQEGVWEILSNAGFDTVHVETTIPTWHYTYQVWIVS